MASFGYQLDTHGKREPELRNCVDHVCSGTSPCDRFFVLLLVTENRFSDRVHADHSFPPSSHVSPPTLSLVSTHPLFLFRKEQASEGQLPNMTKQNTIRIVKLFIAEWYRRDQPTVDGNTHGRGVWEIEGWVLWPAGQQYSLLSALASSLALFGEIC